MSVNHTYIIGGSLEINPNDPKFSKSEADALRGHLWQLRAAIPHFVKIKESEPVGDYEYNLRSPGGDGYEIKRPCGHGYYFSPDTWIRPMCKDCEAWMEGELKSNPGMWHKRSLKKEEHTLKKLFTGKPEEKPAVKPEVK